MDELKAVKKAMRTKVPSLNIQMPPPNPEDKSPSNIFDCKNELQRPSTTRAAELLASNKFLTKTMQQMPVS